MNQLLGAYFVVLPLRDEAALSLGTGVLPALFLGSLVLTMLAAPASSYLLSLPGLPKSKVNPFPDATFSHSSKCKDSLGFDSWRQVS